jgi:hypothetical protein
VLAVLAVLESQTHLKALMEETQYLILLPQ